MAKIMLVAGEVSGDRQVALLSRSLKDMDHSLRLFGAGGEKMREAGVDVRVQTSHLGVVGVSEAFRYIRPLREAFHILRETVLAEHPDAVVLVDNEGFNTAFARFVKQEGIPVIFYFPPQVWLWGRWRARGIARLADLILATFPYEVPVYERVGARVKWIGHPLLDIVKPAVDPEPALRCEGLDPDRPAMALLPGSRFHELRQHLPVMLAAAGQILERHPGMQFILPLAADLWREMIETELRQHSLNGQVTLVTHEEYTLLSCCRAAMVKAGTGTLELALLGIPMVVVYKMNRLSYNMGRWLLKTPYIAMPNILLDEPFVPELRQGQVRPDALAATALKLLEDEEYADDLRRGYRKMREALGSEGSVARAARLILDTATNGESPH
jgi:lipid-A-disaccharide synthase